MVYRTGCHRLVTVVGAGRWCHRLVMPSTSSLLLLYTASLLLFILSCCYSWVIPGLISSFLGYSWVIPGFILLGTSLFKVGFCSKPLKPSFLLKLMTVLTKTAQSPDPGGTPRTLLASRIFLPVNRPVSGFPLKTMVISGFTVPLGENGWNNAGCGRAAAGITPDVRNRDITPMCKTVQNTAITPPDVAKLLKVAECALRVEVYSEHRMSGGQWVHRHLPGTSGEV